MKNAIKWILLVLATLALIGLLAWLIISVTPDNVPVDEVVTDEEPSENDGQTVQNTFKVSFDGNDYFADDVTELILPSSGEVRFDIEGAESYTVEVVSNIHDIENAVLLNYYIIDGGAYLFAADDYTDEFISESNLHNDYFVIECTPDYYDLETLLCRKWNVASVSFAEPVTDEYLYRMTITSADGEEIVVLLNQR